MRHMHLKVGRIVSLNKILILVISALVIATQCIYFLKSPIKTFPDSVTYSYFDFYHWNSWFGGKRSFFYPLVISALQKNHFLIVTFQYILSSACMIYFFYVLNGIIKKPFTKLIFTSIFLGYLLSAAVISWNSCILTESLTFSLFILLTSIGMNYLKNKKNKYLLVLIVIGILTIFTRNFNLLFIVMLLPFYLFLMYKQGISKKKIIILFTISTVIFGLAQYSTSLSDVPDFSFTNIISTRVLTQRDQSILNDFRQNGFPHKIPYLNFEKNPFALSHNPIPSITKWIKEGGKYFYFKYLITHPTYTFAMPFSKQMIYQEFETRYSHSIVNLIFFTLSINYNNEFFINSVNLLKIILFFILMQSDKILYVVFIIFCLALQYAFLKKQRSFNAYLVALYMCLVGLATSVASWHLDSMEVLRHGIFSGFFFYLGFTLIASTLLQHFVETIWRLLCNFRERLGLGDITKGV